MSDPWAGGVIWFGLLVLHPSKGLFFLFAIIPNKPAKEPTNRPIIGASDHNVRKVTFSFSGRFQKRVVKPHTQPIPFVCFLVSPTYSPYHPFIMNANAIAMLKAAADKKKTNWKDPVVKQVRVTKEQYLQEKAEEEAKKNKKKAFLMGNTDDAVGGGGGPDPRVTEALGQIQRERSQLMQEKQQWSTQLEEMKSQMQQMRSQMSALQEQGGATSGSSNSSSGAPTTAAADPTVRRDLDEALERLDTVERENERLRKQIETTKAQATEAKSTAEAAKSTAKAAKAALGSSNDNSNNNGNSNTNSGVSDEDWDELTERIEVLEEKHSKLILSTARDSDTLEDTKEDVQALQKRVGSLEKAAVAAAKRDRSRARSTTRKTTEVVSSEPVKNTSPTTNTAVSSSGNPSLSSKKEAAPPATIPTDSNSSSEPSREAPSRSKSSASSSADVLGPHTAQEVAHAQASDKNLVAYLGKSGGAGMYPKFSMSVKDVDGLKLVFFYKKLYVPETLRPQTLRYYKEHHDADWTRTMAKHVIWPSLDTDVTNFKF